MKQLAVVKPRTWYQAHCNECDADVGSFVPKQETAQWYADRHNRLTHREQCAHPEEERMETAFGGIICAMCSAPIESDGVLAPEDSRP